MSEYTEQAEKFMLDAGLEFRAVYVGEDCPAYCGDAAKDRAMSDIGKFPRRTHIHGNHYRVTLSRKDRGHFTIDFWNSYSDEEENFFSSGYHIGEVENTADKYWDKYRVNRKYPGGPRNRKKIIPTPYDVLACLTKYDPGTFENFCGEYGYDEGSRKAEGVYHAVVKEYKKVRAFFSDAELKLLEEIN